MPKTNRTILTIAVAMLAIGGCRDDMQPDDVASPGANATASATTQPMDAAPGAATGDAALPPMPPVDGVADGGAAPGTEAADRAFARSALASGLSEVKISRHVERQSTTADVRALAKRIADDHEALNRKLRGFAGSGAEAVDTDASSKAMDALIRSSKGADMDRAYLQHMSEGHARSIARYESAQKTARDDGLRTLIGDALPKLHEHARAVDAQLSGAK